VLFTEDDDVVEYLTPKSPHPPFSVPVLPRASRCDAELSDAEVIDPSVENGTVDPVSIADQAGDGGIWAGCLYDLLSGPGGVKADGAEVSCGGAPRAADGGADSRG